MTCNVTSCGGNRCGIIGCTCSCHFLGNIYTIPYTTIATTWFTTSTSTGWQATPFISTQDLRNDIDILTEKLKALTELVKVATDKINQLEAELAEKNENNSDTRKS